MDGLSCIAKPFMAEFITDVPFVTCIRASYGVASVLKQACRCFRLLPNRRVKEHSPSF
jgi:hypothetical protein